MNKKPRFLNNELWLYLIAGGVTLVVCFIRLRFLDVPLERDEGEYAYMGQLLLQGSLPYTEAYSMKFPGIHFVYALILGIFGQTHTAIHSALLITNLATGFLLFLLGRRLFDAPVGIIAGSCFLVLTLSPSVKGFWANTEHFLLLPALGGLLLLRIALEEENKIQLFASGFLLGCALLIKQHGIFFFLFGCVVLGWVYFNKPTTRWTKLLIALGLFVTGGLTPFIVTVLIYFSTGNFEAFWFWTFEYAFEYASMLSLNQGMAAFKYVFLKIFQPHFLIFLFSLLGVASIVWNKEIRSQWFFACGFLLFSFFAITPGFYFRSHYFILLMPALALFAGMGVRAVWSRHSSGKAALSLGIAIIALGHPFFIQQEVFFKLSAIEASRAIYNGNPFPESIEVAKFINKKAGPNDEIAILGSEPQIYFYARRRSATGYLYMYPLMEKHGQAHRMQGKMIREIENSQPKFIVIVNASLSWLMRPDSSRLLIQWYPKYLQERYQLSGVVMIPFDNPRAKTRLLIFERKI
jgi:dolichyl-phosphate-mannose-protein mannosyltransferase